MNETIRNDARAANMAKVRQARLMTPEQKFRAGADLFEEACRWTLAGIVRQFPELDEEGRLQELKRRLDRVERRELA